MIESDEKTPVVIHKAPIEQLIHDIGAMREDVMGELREVRAASARAETAAQRAADETLRLREIVNRHDEWIKAFDRRYFLVPIVVSLVAMIISVVSAIPK